MWTMIRVESNFP